MVLTCEQWLEDYDLYENVYQSALDFFLEDTLSTSGCVCYLKGNDLSFLSNEREVYLTGYQNTPIEKVIRTKTPLISKNKIPCLEDASPFFGIPIQNKERVLGIVILTGSTSYTLQSIRKYKTILLVLRLEMEKLESKIPEETKSKDLFVANMSHEIRTPLNGVIGYTQLLLQTKATEIQQQYIRSINKCSLNLAQIINDILDFSKLSSGKMKIVNEPLSIREVLEFVQETLSPRINDKKHSFKIYISPDVPEYCTSDKQKIIQILMNLVSNAIKFTDKGGKIEIFVRIYLDKIRISVNDTGVGISRENQNKLFRSFSQLDNNLTKSYDGTGLGLVISKKLVELLQGEIGFKSKVHIGSEFYFTFKYEVFDESKCSISSKYKGKTVLVINGNTDERIKLCDILFKIGLKPTPSSSFNEGIKLLQKYDFEMCIVESRSEYSEHSEQKGESDRKESEEFEKKIADKFPLLPVLPVLSSDKIPRLIERVECAFRDSRYIKKKDSLKVKKDLRILIAEDNPENQGLLIGLIKSLQYTNITVANDGIEAIQKLSDHDVILLDLKMPRLDGFQVMEYIQRTKTKIQVVPVTASVLDEDQDRCAKYGVKGFLRKPIDLRELQQILLI